MKNIFFTLILMASPTLSLAKTNCTIQAVLNESQFFLKDFTDVTDGFAFEINHYRYFFFQDEATQQSTIQIQSLVSNKTYSATEKTEPYRPLRLDVFENGRPMASMVCRGN